MQTATTLYARHRGKCSHDKDRNYHRRGCPIWFQRNRKRWSAETNDQAEALKRAAAMESGEQKLRRRCPRPLSHQAFKKFKDATKAPHKDRYMLTQGSKKQQSLLAWATEQRFKKLRQPPARTLSHSLPK
jgi:hypothetical protein